MDTKGTWEEEFLEEFAATTYLDGVAKENIVSFFGKEIQKAKREVISEIDKLFHKECTTDCESCGVLSSLKSKYTV